MPKPMFREDRCKSCELCRDVCPQKIIVMSQLFNSKGYQPATCPDATKCTGCTLCARACPDVVIEIYK